MRDDIVTLICEKRRKPGDESSHIRNRFNKNKKGKFRRNYSLEDLDNDFQLGVCDFQWDCSQQSSPMNIHGKSLSDHLGAIKGWIRKQEGRNWTDVKQEFDKQIKIKFWLQNHVWSHVLDFIFPPENVLIINDVTYGRRFKKSNFFPITEGLLYVDPVDNIIKWGKVPRTKKQNGRFILKGTVIRESLADVAVHRHIITPNTIRWFRKINDEWIETIILKNLKIRRGQIVQDSENVEIPVDSKTVKKYKLNG